ncbi:Aerobic-type carbon monoxide dehydrogenase, small subunit, CoxS/CutS family [Burkholderia sp. CF099]|nr:Aerobic-type carbon monoxide dehydrogenase, small subunit, CoxS/CutS family [Burkholderia sp. CF099]
MSTLHVNGHEHTVDVAPDTPILWALRDTLGMTGTKFGCGACTVHLDGQAIRSCVTPISVAQGKQITTIEATTDGSDKVGAIVHAAWVKYDVAQCGYCQSDQIMSATAFLKSLPRGRQPTVVDAETGRARFHEISSSAYVFQQSSVALLANTLRLYVQISKIAP